MAAAPRSRPVLPALRPPGGVRADALLLGPDVDGVLIIMFISMLLTLLMPVGALAGIAAYAEWTRRERSQP